MFEPTISPYIRLAWDSMIRNVWHVPERQLWDYEILYLMEGQLLLTVENCTYHGIPGDVFILKPRRKHSIKLIGEGHVRQPHIHFDLFEQIDSRDVPISFVCEEEMTEQE